MSQSTAPISMPQSDGDLLAVFAAGRQEAAFAEVVRRHGGMVISVCRSVLGNTADAEDAAQAVFLTLAQKAHQSAVRTHLVGWLHRVAWYVAARGAEAASVRRRHEQAATRIRQEVLPFDGDPVDPEALHAGLAELPDKYRVALILHHLEGRSHAETASLAGCSTAAIAVRLHRGREMLRKRLERRGAAASMILAGVWGKSAVASPGFVATTTEAATAVLAGPAASTAAVSGQAIALSNGAVKMLFAAKMKTAAAFAAGVIFTGGVIGTIAVSRGVRAPAPPPPVAATMPAAGQQPAAARSVPVPAPPVPPPSAGRPRVVTGQVVRAIPGSVTIQPQIGPLVTVVVDAATAVTFDGKPAALDDLRIGVSVGIFFENGKPATEIRAIRAAPPPDPTAIRTMNDRSVR